MGIFEGFEEGLDYLLEQEGDGNWWKVETASERTALEIALRLQKKGVNFSQTGSGIVFYSAENPNMK
jgi:hypothetical protein